MRVTIEHREVSAGIMGNKRNHFIDCNVEFSEEEKAIIKRRNLGDLSLKVESDVPSGSGFDAEGIGSGLIQTITRLCVVGGVISIFASPFVKVPETLPFYLFLIALGLFIFRKKAERRSDASNNTRVITVRDLLKNSRFTIYGVNPAVAKGMELDLREQLTHAKNVIAASAEVPTKSTFEL